MANIQAVTERHKWKETVLMRGYTKIKGLICTNCRAYHFLDSADSPPVTGCSISADCTRMGDARLADLREQEMALRAAQDARERADDEALLRGRT